MSNASQVHSNQGKGRRGEQLAAEYLRAQGYKIVERNFRAPVGEIDLVAEQNRSLYLVEVKLRTSRKAGGPLAQITAHKRIHLVRTAEWYLKVRPRFTRHRIFLSVVGILDSGNSQEIQWVPDAFEA